MQLRNLCRQCGGLGSLLPCGGGFCGPCPRCGGSGREPRIRDRDGWEPLRGWLTPPPQPETPRREDREGA